jgi:hypothetical protein
LSTETVSGFSLRCTRAAVWSGRGSLLLGLNDPWVILHELFQVCAESLERITTLGEVLGALIDSHHSAGLRVVQALFNHGG